MSFSQRNADHDFRVAMMEEEESGNDDTPLQLKFFISITRKASRIQVRGLIQVGVRGPLTTGKTYPLRQSRPWLYIYFFRTGMSMIPEISHMFPVAYHTAHTPVKVEMDGGDE